MDIKKIDKVDKIIREMELWELEYVRDSVYRWIKLRVKQLK